MDTPTQICSRCKQSFPLTSDYFHRNKNHATGFQPRCKTCASEENHKHYLKYKELIIVRVGKYRKGHPEKRKEECRRRYIKHKSRINEINERWRLAHPEKKRSYVTKYQSKPGNRERKYETTRLWRATHQQEIREWEKKWREKNPDKLLKWREIRGLDMKTRRLLGLTPRAIYDRDRGICHLCKRKVSFRDASMDHIIPVSKGGLSSWENLALAHLKCNLKRGVDRIPAQYRLF